MCKLLEKIVQKSYQYLKHNNSLSPYQAGFKNNRSTQDSIVELESTIHNAFGKKQKLIAIFFDLKKAYDDMEVWDYQENVKNESAGQYDTICA